MTTYNRVGRGKSLTIISNNKKSDAVHVLKVYEICTKSSDVEFLLIINYIHHDHKNKLLF